jgi:DNA helicase-2/ATP-dependent DNA helicase PcrA
MNFSKSQLKAITHHTGNCAVLASAGSGKTSVLTNRIKHLIKEYDEDPKSILAITFSRKAANNMKERLSTLIPEEYEHIQIETFHALGYRVLSDYGYLPY